MEGGPIAIGTTIASSFAFGHSDHFELIWGYTTPLPGLLEQRAFDSSLNKADLIAFLSAGPAQSLLLALSDVVESSP